MQELEKEEMAKTTQKEMLYKMRYFPIYVWGNFFSLSKTTPISTVVGSLHILKLKVLHTMEQIMNITETANVHPQRELPAKVTMAK